MHPKTEQFLEELEALCEKHGVSVFNPCCVDQIVTLTTWPIANMLRNIDTTSADGFFEETDRRKADREEVLRLSNENPTK